MPSADFFLAVYLVGVVGTSVLVARLTPQVAVERNLPAWFVDCAAVVCILAWPLAIIAGWVALAAERATARKG